MSEWFLKSIPKDGNCGLAFLKCCYCERKFNIELTHEQYCQLVKAGIATIGETTKTEINMCTCRGQGETSEGPSNPAKQNGWSGKNGTNSIDHNNRVNGMNTTPSHSPAVSPRLLSAPKRAISTVSRSTLSAPNPARPPSTKPAPVLARPGSAHRPSPGNPAGSGNEKIDRLNEYTSPQARRRSASTGNLSNDSPTRTTRSTVSSADPPQPPRAPPRRPRATVFTGIPLVAMSNKSEVRRNPQERARMAFPSDSDQPETQSTPVQRHPPGISNSGEISRSPNQVAADIMKRKLRRPATGVPAQLARMIGVQSPFGAKPSRFSGQVNKNSGNDDDSDDDDLEVHDPGGSIGPRQDKELHNSQNPSRPILKPSGGPVMSSQRQDMPVRPTTALEMSLRSRPPSRTPSRTRRDLPIRTANQQQPRNDPEKTLARGEVPEPIPIQNNASPSHYNGRQSPHHLDQNPVHLTGRLTESNGRAYTRGRPATPGTSLMRPSTSAGRSHSKSPGLPSHPGSTYHNQNGSPIDHHGLTTKKSVTFNEKITDNKGITHVMSFSDCSDASNEAVQDSDNDSGMAYGHYSGSITSDDGRESLVKKLFSMLPMK